MPNEFDPARDIHAGCTAILRNGERDGPLEFLRAWPVCAALAAEKEAGR